MPREGYTLIEVLVALAILGIVGVALFGGMTTATLATPIAQEHSTAQDIAESQMEYIRGQPYDNLNDPPQYDLLPDVPEGYRVILSASRLDPEGDGPEDDDGLQKIVLTVKHGEKTVTTLEAYKVR